MTEQLKWNFEQENIAIENMNKWFIYSDYIKKSDRLYFTIAINNVLKEYGCPYELKNGNFVIRRYQNKN